MKTKEKIREEISAFADGELAEEQVEVLLADLHRNGQAEDWELYHRIGDVLRSDDMDVKLSAGFSERLAARLAEEPIVIAPALASRPAASGPRKQTDIAAPARRWAIPGAAAAAAAAAIAFFAGPQLMVAMNGAQPTPMPPEAQLAATGQEPHAVVLRDPGIDEYLIAHQRFSPSVYSTAQYARAATFANDTDK